MHTDATLAILDHETSALGNQLREFQCKTCPAFQTRELKREMDARKRRKHKQGVTVDSSTLDNSPAADQRQSKTLNLQTYKVHALGDYVATIMHYGTTDSYTTETASCIYIYFQP
jgi:hypothetical protein